MKSRSQFISTYLFLIVLVIACMTTAQAQEVQVNSANPMSAVQGTLDLDVEIAGSGFDKSAAVDFFVGGSTTNRGGITIKKVKVRGSKKIIATINISDTAETELAFDIEVTLLSSGRRGRGTTLFRVLKKGGGGNGGGNPDHVNVEFRDSIPPNQDRLTSDGGGAYIHNVDMVGTGIGTSGFFFLKLSKGNKNAIRKLSFDFSRCFGSPCTPPFSVGSSVGALNIFTPGIDLRAMNDGQFRSDLVLEVDLNLNSVDLGLWHLFFDSSNMDCQGAADATVTASATVPGTPVDTWVIVGQTACLVQGGHAGEQIFSGLYDMPFSLTVKTN